MICFKEDVVYVYFKILMPPCNPYICFVLVAMPGGAIGARGLPGI